MALMSMTGYGCGEAHADGFGVEIEIGSVNRKQFDARVGLPRSLASLESRVCELLQRSIGRGSVSVSVRVRCDGAGEGEGVSVNHEVAKAYLAKLRRVAAELGLVDDLTAQSLLALPGVIGPSGVIEEPDRVWPAIRKAVSAALEGLVSMRAAEGKALEKDLLQRFDRLKRKMAVVKKLAPRVPRRHHAALRKRLAALGIASVTEDPMVAREVALAADRSDITEELVRLESHFGQAARLMASGKPAGRALDFLCQEFFREINTIGSKAGDAVISRHVVEFKAALETIREQVQNVE